MKKFIALLLFMPQLLFAQNYITKGDSCFEVKDYNCAGINYDLYLKTDDSNGIAYRSALSWSLANNKEKALDAIRTYVKFNYSNGVIMFSKRLLNNNNFSFLKSDPQWKAIIAGVQAKELEEIRKEKKKVDSALAVQHRIESGTIFKKLNFNHGSVKEIYKKIKLYNNYPSIQEKHLSFQFKITDTTHTAFLIVMPPNYDPKKSYPLLFFLHGAVSSNSGYLDLIEPQWDTSGWNRFYTKYANQVIMVYPHGNKDYNWMYPDNGFYMVPDILKQIKQVINVDDNRAFITGHSNGATGSFSYLIKQPSPFAAFYGFNTRPRVETGGTYLKNILNRSYFNISTDKDYYYPPDANDSLSTIMRRMGADYQDHRFEGFPHWFPKFDESEPAYTLLFSDLAKRKRNPYHSNIYWECDNVKYGSCDWVQITALDTNAKRKPWQEKVNFQIKNWIVLGKNDTSILRDTALLAYKYFKKSGAIKGYYKNNVFRLETSCVKSVSIMLSPEMINFDLPISVIINNKLLYKQKVSYNRSYLINTFKKTADRSALWVNQIDLKI